MRRCLFGAGHTNPLGAELDHAVLEAQIHPVH